MASACGLNMARRTAQLSLFEGDSSGDPPPTPAPAKKGKPNPDAEAKPKKNPSHKRDRPPVFWVQEARILRRLSHEPAEEIRRITLRRGLNVIWAPPLRQDAPGLSFSGHAAGKTSLCRLLRYVLGEPKCGSPFLLGRLHERLPTGWVVARIWVEGHPWLVARPLTGRRRSVCTQMEDIDAWLRNAPAESSDFEIFRVTLHQAVIGQLPVQSFGQSGQSIRFLHLLAWLARDQECRLGSLLAWRHQESQSGTPPIGADDRRFLIRTVVGLMDREIRQEMEHRVSLEEDLKRLPSEIVFRQRTVQEAIAELRPFIDQAHDSIADPLFAEATERQLRHQEALELEALQPAGALSLEERRRALHRAMEAKGAAHYAITTWEGEPCGVDADLAHRHCPFHADLPQPLPKKGVLVTKNRRAAAERSFKSAAERVDQLEREYDETLQNGEAQRRGQEQIRAHYRSVQEHLNRAVTAQATLEALLDMRERLASEITASQERQEALQRRWNREASQFAEIYRKTMQRLLGHGTDAECRFTRENIKPMASYNGDLNSAAINTLITLGFDVSALQFAVNGRGHHPRFLIHDSPREADMDSNLYRRLFSHVRALENGPGQPQFQYIVTSTEAPPPELCQEPWIRLRLDASQASERLFRLDL